MSVVLVSAVAVAALQASPAAASTTGEVVFHCTMRMPAWPSPNANGGCDGTAVVSVNGIDHTGTPYVLAGPGTLDMGFTYSAACIAGGPPLLWGANGVIHVSGINAVRGGARTTATLTANVSITGMGPSFLFVTQNHRVAFSDGAAASGTTGFGDASMVLLLSVANVCPVGGPVTGVVDGRWHLVV